MENNLSCYEDVSVVAGLRSCDNVLFIGGNIAMPSIKKYAKSIVYAKKQNEINDLIKNECQFDRVFVARENLLDELMVIKATQLTAVNGLVCFLSDTDEIRDAFIDIVERNFPTASVWSLKSNVGILVVTNARGNPSWME